MKFINRAFLGICPLVLKSCKTVGLGIILIGIAASIMIIIGKQKPKK